MDTTKNLRLARFLKKFLNLIFGLLVTGGIALVIWSIALPLILGQSDFQVTASIPVRIGMGEEPRLDLNLNGNSGGRIEAAFVDKADGTLRFETRSYQLFLIANIANIFTLAGLAYIFYQTRAFVKLIVDGKPFDEQAGFHLKRLGYAVMIIGIGNPIVQFIAASEIINDLSATIPILSPGPTFKVEVILGSLLVLMLAHIWSYGIYIERERALTI